VAHLPATSQIPLLVADSRSAGQDFLRPGGPDSGAAYLSRGHCQLTARVPYCLTQHPAALQFSSRLLSLIIRSFSTSFLIMCSFLASLSVFSVCAVSTLFYSLLCPHLLSPSTTGALTSCPVGPGFSSRLLRHAFVVSISSCKSECLELGHDHFLPHLCQLVIH
jgi:hypothetical protein